MRRVPVDLDSARPAPCGVIARSMGWLAEMGIEEHPKVREARLRTLLDPPLLFWLGVGWSVGAAGLALLLDPASWMLLWLATGVLTQSVRSRLTRRHIAGGDDLGGCPGDLFLFATLVSLVALAPGIFALSADDDPRLFSLGIVLTLGWMSYTASRLSAAVPRMATLLLVVFSWSMSIGLLTSSTMWPIGLMGLTFPFAYYVMMIQSHALIAGALRAEHENHVRSMHDPLTGLPNRLGLQEWFDRWRDRPESESSDGLAVLCLDLDGFKNVNDTLGHGAGDEVLKLVSDRIRAAIGSDDLACRLGGDEFIVLLSIGDERGAISVAERLIAACAEPYRLSKGKSAEVGVSVGIDLPINPAPEVDAVIAPADRALYVSKSAAKGSWTLAGTGPVQAL